MSDAKLPGIEALTEAAALAKLPGAERKDCRRLWDEVVPLVKKAGEGKWHGKGASRLPAQGSLK
jgi:hypothetical protein